jgi:hypothetical protein
LNADPSGLRSQEDWRRVEGLHSHPLR